MSLKSFLNLYDSAYFAKVLSCVFKTWSVKSMFSSVGNPKKTELLLYVNDCKANFTFKNGEVLTAESGDIVYVPKGSEYMLCISERNEKSGCTLALNFLLYDEYGEGFIASEKPLLFKVSNTEYYHRLFSQMSKISDASIKSTSKLNAYFFEIVSSLCELFYSKSKIKKNFHIIEKGIKYLETDHKLDKSVAEIADMCMVSENYFRRLFKEYAGVSPKEYILNAKIDKAKLRLQEDYTPIAEIAEICGFPDVAYFCRVFKKRTGFTPFSYRNLNFDEVNEKED